MTPSSGSVLRQRNVTALSTDLNASRSQGESKLRSASEPKKSVDCSKVDSNRNRY